MHHPVVLVALVQTISTIILNHLLIWNHLLIHLLRVELVDWWLLEMLLGPHVGLEAPVEVVAKRLGGNGLQGRRHYVARHLFGGCQLEINLCSVETVFLM